MKELDLMNYMNKFNENSQFFGGELAKSKFKYDNPTVLNNYMK